MKKRHTDTWLVAAFFVLMLLGIIMVYSSSAFYAQHYFNDHLYFLKRHLTYLFIGLGAMAVAYKLPLEKFKGYTWFLLFVGAGILFYAAFVENGRWIRLGPLHFQAVDTAKFSLILFFADSLSRKENLLLKYNEGLFPHLFYLTLFAAMILIQPDFSSAVMLILIGLTMLFVAPIKLTHLILTVAAFVPLLLAVILLSPYKMQRILAFLNPREDVQGSGYQVYQSLVSLGSGGVNGVGFANSTQKMFFLPEAHTDFIFSIIGEEWGLLGTLLVVFLFGIIMMRGIRAARRIKDRFIFYLTIGITAHFVFYAMINMMVTLHLVPATGLPLPFISYGGTALLFSCVYAGLLFRISNETLDRLPVSSTGNASGRTVGKPSSAKGRALKRNRNKAAKARSRSSKPNSSGGSRTRKSTYIPARHVKRRSK